MSRRAHGFSWEKLDGLLALGSHKPMCAAIMDCSEDTIVKRIKDEYGITFTEYREMKLSVTKVKLIQKAIQKAMSGENVMLIFCLKNICNWRDKQPGEEDKTIVHQHKDLSDEELDQKIKHMVSKKKKLMAETATTKSDG